CFTLVRKGSQRLACLEEMMAERVVVAGSSTPGPALDPACDRLVELPAPRPLHVLVHRLLDGELRKRLVRVTPDQDLAPLDEENALREDLDAFQARPARRQLDEHRRPEPATCHGGRLHDLAQVRLEPIEPAQEELLNRTWEL